VVAGHLFRDDGENHPEENAYLRRFVYDFIAMVAPQCGKADIERLTAV